MKKITKPVRDKSDFLVFGQPCIDSADIAEVVHCLESRWIGTGPNVARFEKDFARYKGVSNVLAVCSCTAGLHLACLLLDLKPEDEVITTALTFCATVNAIIHSGATPVLADIDPDSMNIDPEDVERKITDRTKAIIVVHMAGRPCEMTAIMQIAEKHGLSVIEDCAHAIEAEYKNEKAGTIGAFGVFSFYATKNLTTGEGGMLLARSKKHIERARQLSLHGLSSDAWGRFRDDGYKHYYVYEAGFKYNMMDLQAALGLHQLERLDKYAERRKQVWRKYQQGLAATPLKLPAEEDPGTKNARHLFVVLVDERKCGISRDQFLGLMNDHHIGVGVHYLSIPEHPYYQKTFSWDPAAWPNALRIGRQAVSLPFSGCLSDRDVEDVISAVRDILR